LAFDGLNCGFRKITVTPSPYSSFDCFLVVSYAWGKKAYPVAQLRVSALGREV